MQQIAFVDTETGECQERRLAHCAKAEQFYREWKRAGMNVRVGIEATGQSRWFERLLAELDFELWIVDPARIRAKQVRKQKDDRMDAAHMLKLMLKDDFPRIWVPSPENRDVRQLVWRRHRMVQMRSRVMNQLQAIAMNEGVRRKRGLWSQTGRVQLESLALPPWTSRRREELLERLDRFDPSINDLTEAAEQEARRHPGPTRVMGVIEVSRKGKSPVYRFAAGQYCPTHAGQLVGHGYDQHIARRPSIEPIHPLAESSSVCRAADHPINPLVTCALFPCLSVEPET